MSQSEHPVGIVGAGPVGLVTAARLAHLGIPSVILEADPELRRQGSKACLIQGDVLEVLDTFGCAEPIAAEGVAWHIAHTYARDREIRRTVYPRPIGYGPFVNISQYRIEQVVLAHVEADPRCQVRWSHAVTGVRQDDDGVTVRAETPEGTSELRFAYLVAADGVRSTLREAAGVTWTGYTHKDRFLITDIRARLDLPKDRHFHYDPSSNPGRQLIIHPQPDDVWRIDWQLHPAADIDAERASGAFDRRVHAVIGDVGYSVEWLSTYRFHQRVVTDFRVGRVFFAGDAAHALPPYGARGMNSGIQDADNLAWKLALVLHGQADESLLDSYHTERHAAALENLRITEATIRFMVPPSLPRRWARSLLLHLAAPIAPLRDRINSGRMAEPYVYTDSPIVDPAGRHPLVGRFAPDGWITVGGRRERLRRIFGDAFVGLYVGSDAAAARAFVAAAQPSEPPAVPARLTLLLDAGVDVAGDPAAAGLPVTVAHADDEGLRQRYHASTPTWFLVRPDGHVAAAFDGARGAEFAAALARCAAAVTDHGRAGELDAAGVGG